MKCIVSHCHHLPNVKVDRQANPHGSRFVITVLNPSYFVIVVWIANVTLWSMCTNTLMVKEGLHVFHCLKPLPVKSKKIQMLT